MISRQAAVYAIDEISSEVADGYGFDYAKWREYFCELPSILGTNLAEVGTDCISRQDALDICDHAIDLFKGQFGAGVLVAIKESIEELPPAEPKRIRAKWIATTALQEGQITWRDYKCSNCSHHRARPMNFCEVCGAKMER